MGQITKTDRDACHALCITGFLGLSGPDGNLSCEKFPAPAGGYLA